MRWLKYNSVLVLTSCHHRVFDLTVLLSIRAMMSMWLDLDKTLKDKLKVRVKYENIQLTTALGCSRKNPHPPDGWDSGNSRGRGGQILWKSRREGGWTWKSLLQGSFWPIIRAIRTLSSVTVHRSQTLKIVQIFCSDISHLTKMINVCVVFL